ncbi:uncharacterized protein LOC110701917 [Chenopodium quinoa]|uniref:uncharacterized protein LOC110701917 n=1 Tax=Chenopodium quinoa TaxID=63459 RepID=UPI000B78DC5F|nr:uncharacterized protein LOC110701917 [Chenopodium quinoa]
MPTEKSPNKLKSEVGYKDIDKNHRHRRQDAFLLEGSPASESKQDVKDASSMLDSKTNRISERTSHSNPTAVSRGSYHQHDDRRTAARDGSRSGRRSTSERGWWSDSRDEDRAAHRSAPSNPKVREEKARAQGGINHAWRHDKFLEAESDAHPPTKKRRPFREEKLPLKSENENDAVPEPSKFDHPASSTGGTGRWDHRARDRRPLERNEHDRGYVRERSFSNRGRVENTGFPPRGRFSGADNDGKFKGRDNFGGRQGYRSSGSQVEKWKHDMYDEANRSPTPKKEEDPVAKVEALLSL